jgi:hypothetical protein
MRSGHLQSVADLTFWVVRHVVTRNWMGAQFLAVAFSLPVRLVATHTGCSGIEDAAAALILNVNFCLAHAVGDGLLTSTCTNLSRESSAAIEMSDCCAHQLAGPPDDLANRSSF